MSAIRILLVDDHPLFRQGVAYTLSREPDFTVVGEASTGRQALALARALAPDVVLLDITMPEGDGLATAAQIADQAPGAHVVMLTASEDGEDLVTAMKVGARGYVVKGAGAAEVVAAVRSVAAGEAYITPRMAGNLLLEMTQKPATDPLNDLTEREREVLALLAKGMTNREIGLQLSLAEKTVKHYVTAVLQKLHVRSRVEAALLAQRQQPK
jgi:two-component system nitrate/nitrite response regulator NarL